jgi:hypothetical protein
VAEILDAIEFQRLYDSRELAALNCVNAIQFVLAFFEAQDFEGARKHLQHALDQHKAADDAITEFHKSQTQKKENSNVRSSASRSDVA